MKKVLFLELVAGLLALLAVGWCECRKSTGDGSVIIQLEVKLTDQIRSKYLF